MKSKYIGILGLLVAIMFLATAVIILSYNKNKNTFDEYDESTQLSEYYENVTNDKVNKIIYSDNAYVDYHIKEILEINKYNSVKVLDSWYDSALGVNTYYVLFDDNILYNISIDSNNIVYSNIDDYQMWLDTFGGE